MFSRKPGAYIPPGSVDHTEKPVFFFFKQKTAYEIFTCLEFRRVLFRSGSARAVSVVRTESRSVSRDATSLCDARGLRFGHGASSARDFRHLALAGIATKFERRSPRSEERRVGKECRSRLSPYP